MNIYVIDSCRIAAWKTIASSGLQICLVHEANEFPPLRQEDMVFGHTHLDSTGDAPDLALAGWLEEYPHSKPIREFLEQLRAAHPVPRIILYSGDPLDSSDHEEFTALATSSDGPLHGICRSRIKWLAVAVDREIQAADLGALVGGEIGGHTGGLSATTMEVLSALLLLCECHLIHRGKLQLPAGVSKRGRAGSRMTISVPAGTDSGDSTEATLHLHDLPSGWKAVLGDPTGLCGALAELKKSGMQATLDLVDTVGSFNSERLSKPHESLIELAYQEMAGLTGSNLG